MATLRERPIEYATIPAVAAFVGLSTNLMGVKMLFYPIEYAGFDWHRPGPHSPWGVLGWQGVVPCKTEQMAGRLVEIVTRKLLSLTEAFGRLEARPLADLLFPAVDEAVRRDCGEAWAWVLRPFLPMVLSHLVVALQKEIEDLLDLRSVVLSAFVRDKVVLVDLFQKVGRVELDFLVESGLGFGAILGIAQMIAWVVAPRPWTLPVAGAFVGYITNWIAIKLLFEPAEPQQFGSFVLQGLFESRQLEVSDEFGNFMANRVVSSHRLLEALASGGDDGELYAFLRRQLPYPIPSHILTAAVQAIKTCATDPKAYPELHAYVTEQLDIEQTLASRLKLLSPSEFEDLLHPVFQEDEITLITVGGLLGALAGMAQTRLGWGGPGATLKAMCTIMFVSASSVAYFVIGKNKEVDEEMKEEVKEADKEVSASPVRPQLRRRNTVLRVQT
uniref:Uncharacterized protein n=1 Tax=Trieres chinensis TaxID=1514140 RepID=A0A7S2A1R6_TRICV